jgi:8-oxo-dGTP pyrophosphatase MutT (NUDIX family)
MDAASEPPIRKAATLVCVRDGADGPEILVVRRAASARFLGGYVAFPGGAVDGADEDAASAWFGDAEHAHRAAAIRELHEEVGLVVTAAGVRSGGLQDVAVAPPSLSQVVEICHWVAPSDIPFRFDTRYYAAYAPMPFEPTIHEAEVDASWWVSPRRLLEEWTKGEHKLYWPTWFTMAELAACTSAEQLLALRFETRDPTPHEEATLPSHVMEDE